MSEYSFQAEQRSERRTIAAAPRSTERAAAAIAVNGPPMASLTSHRRQSPAKLLHANASADGAASVALPSAGAAEWSGRSAQARRYSLGSFRKRLFDLTFAAAALVLLAPVLVLIWSAIRLTSKGPGLFWSERIGRHGAPFLMPKFRTMLIAAPEAPRELLANPDAHITSIGKVLRRWSLDELPQLLCVIAGDMSLVGPRPLIGADPAHKARTAYAEALSVRPGLTGLAQVRGRNLVSPRRKARLDAFYARMRSGWFDVELIARTVIVIITGRGFL